MWTSTASRVPSPTLEQRLLAGLKQDPSTGCWMWTRGTSTHGRGVIRFNQDKMVTVPRAAAFLWLGVPIEGDGVVLACHQCDQPLCARPHPEHLYVGDYSRNELDSYERGQRTLKLTEEDVRRIQQLSGIQSQREIARSFGVSQQHVSNVISGNKRTHMHESDLAKKMAERIRRRGGWARKIAGGPGQSGLPDIIGCYRRYFLGLEVKMPGKEHNVTVLQQKTLDTMRAAGGITAVVTTVQQVERIMDRIDRAYDG